MDTTKETQMTLLEVRGALRAGQRTPPIIQMSQDPREAVAYALAVIRGDEDKIGKRDALAQLSTRIERFIEGDTDDALRELAATMPLMEAMMVRYAMEAAQTSDVERKFRLTKLALQCQSSFARSLVLLAGLKAQRKGQGRVVVHDDPEERD
jgi:hypothetical protein